MRMEDEDGETPQEEKGSQEEDADLISELKARNNWLQSELAESSASNNKE